MENKIKFVRIKKGSTTYFIPVKTEGKKKFYWNGSIQEVERYGLGPGSWEDKKKKMYAIENYGEVDSLYYNGGRVEDYLLRDSMRWEEFENIKKLKLCNEW